MVRLIDADAMVREIWEMTVQPEWCKILTETVIRNQPTVDAVPVKHGKWIDTEAIRINTGEIRKARTCSICGAGYFRYDLEGDVIGDVPRYCPNCGARMDAERKDND